MIHLVQKICYPTIQIKRVNAIIENAGKRIKINITEVKTLLRGGSKKMVEEGLIVPDSKERYEKDEELL